MQRIGSWVWAVVALGGCEQVELGRAVSAIDICNGFTCENSDELLYRGFRGFLKNGAPNEQGMSIRTVDGRPKLYDASGGAWDLYVEHHRIIGRGPKKTISGKDLIGAEIIIDDDNQPPFAIHIDHVRTIQFPFGAPDELDAYTLTWRRHDEQPNPFSPDRRLCNAMPFPNPKERADQLLGLGPDETVVFAGDYYDIEHVRTRCDDDWINFGCAGQTLAKLLLTRNTCESQVRPPGADEEKLAHERQATLKLLVADYCDTGAHFTVSGEPLVWKGGLVDLATHPTTLEARWDENGAICVGTPRLVENPAPPEAGFPSNIWGFIVQTCGGQPPPCAPNTDPYDMGGALRLSSNRLASP